MNRHYQEHCRKMKFIKNCNRFIGEPDYKQVITAWVEAVIVKHLSRKFPYDSRSILTWEELSSTNQYVRKYREIDGLFAFSEGLIYVEVKASLSKSNLKRGKTQVNENLKLLTTIDPNVTTQHLGMRKSTLKKRLQVNFINILKGSNFQSLLMVRANGFGYSMKWMSLN